MTLSEVPESIYEYMAHSHIHGAELFHSPLFRLTMKKSSCLIFEVFFLRSS